MSFETDIKPMFREEDRDAMDFVFDLWKYDDVKENAELIYARSRTVPCPATANGARSNLPPCASGSTTTASPDQGTGTRLAA